MTENRLPDLCAEGHVVIATVSYPPDMTAVSVVMHNLLSKFNPESYTVVTARRTNDMLAKNRARETVHYISSSVRFSSRIDKVWQRRQVPLMVVRLTRIVKRLRPRVIVAVYPDYYFLNAVQAAAKTTRTPWMAYLHDTVAEAMSHTPLAKEAEKVQKQTFAEASNILVMSRGMADLYKKKYGLATTPLEHTYPETVTDTLPKDPPLRQAFWSGTIYAINAHAVSRIAQALKNVDCTLLLTMKNSITTLEKLGVSGPHLKEAFCPTREEYLSVLQQQGILVLALDYPDESPIHEDELSTIFPTKTPEYLASGRPILVHCPDHYFMARFIKENGCGVVVSERSVAALEEACRYLLENSPEVQEMGRRALEAVSLFSSDRVVSLFQEEVRKTAHLKWGERVEQKS
jgi:hypothetical protein